ncbi:hypothetical protein HHI36_012045 [Cryptolaemus montrouzieri]|uniref:Uncharacterized protein n=1 Tax=Cryptolaemus montrouzieri TaxID=559131 RepID=A0ABD2ND46_9CUCU
MPEQYNNFNTAWDSTPKTENKLTKLIARLIMEESRGNDSEAEGVMAFKASEEGKERSKYQNRKVKGKDHVKCSKCSRFGLLPVLAKKINKNSARYVRRKPVSLKREEMMNQK